MFREIRQSREDPKVLAAKAEEQYNKVQSNIVWLFFLLVRGHMNITLLHSKHWSYINNKVFIPLGEVGYMDCTMSFSSLKNQSLRNILIKYQFLLILFLNLFWFFS